MCTTLSLTLSSPRERAGTLRGRTANPGEVRVDAVDTCVHALRDGCTPGDIAAKEGISLATVLSFLDRAVGENRIARSEIYFSIPRAVRENVELACSNHAYRPDLARGRPVAVEPIVE